MGQKLLQHKRAHVGHPQYTGQGLLLGKMGGTALLYWVVEKEGGCGRNILFN